MNINIIKKNYKSIDFNKYTNIYFIGLAFSIPISKALTSLFTALIIISWLLEGNILKKIAIIKYDKLSISLLFLIFLSIFSLLWSPDLLYGIDFIFRKYWHFLVIPIMLTSFKVRYTKYVINAFLLSMLISELVSYGIFFEIWTYDNVASSDPSPFMNHVDYSIFLAFTIFIIATKLYYEQNLSWKIVYSLYFLTALANLFINGGRTGQITFILTIFIVSILYFKRTYKMLLLSVVVSISTLIIAYNFSPNFNDRIHQLKTELTNMYTNNNFQGSASTRIALWTVGATAFLDNPIYGTGIGAEMDDVKDNSIKYGFTHLERYSDYHNTFVQYAVQLGILGLLIPIFVFYTLFTLKFKTEQYKLLATSFTIIFFFQSMGGFSFHIMNSLVLLCTFAALFNALSYQEKSLNDKNIP